MSGFELDLLPETFAVVRLAPTRGCPDWARASAWLSVTEAPDETSIVCHEAVVPDTVEAQRGLRCLQVRGPLDFSQTGSWRPWRVPSPRPGSPSSRSRPTGPTSCWCRRRTWSGPAWR